MIYKTGQTVNCELKLKILRAFALDGNVYYIFGVLKKDTPLRYIVDHLYGVLNVEGSHDSIPLDAYAKAEQLIQNENLLNKIDE